VLPRPLHRRGQLIAMIGLGMLISMNCDCPPLVCGWTTIWRATLLAVSAPCSIAGWEKSRLHHQLARMCTRGLITQERYGSRGIYAAITAKGLAALKDAVPARAREVRRLFIDRLGLGHRVRV
jgi:hypothetical protein